MAFYHGAGELDILLYVFPYNAEIEGRSRIFFQEAIKKVKAFQSLMADIMFHHLGVLEQGILDPKIP